AATDAGAVTFGNGTTGVTGSISAVNSAIGLSANSALSFTVAVDDSNGTFFARFVDDGNGRVLVGSQTDGFVTPNVSVDSTGNLVLEDRDGARNDNLTISLEGSNYRISDSSNELQPGLGTFLAANGDVLISAASVTGAIVINGNSGDDVLTLDFAGGNPIPAGGISFDGGVGV
ncbi:unnamed protein product, partial [Hapterophycus canaliculatus]